MRAGTDMWEGIRTSPELGRGVGKAWGGTRYIYCATLTTGRYSLNGSIINMKSESSEYIGQINGDTLELEFYSHKTKKGGEHVFTYHPVETIRQDVFNQTGFQQEASQP